MQALTSTYTVSDERQEYQTIKQLNMEVHIR